VATKGLLSEGVLSTKVSSTASVQSGATASNPLEAIICPPDTSQGIARDRVAARSRKCYEGVTIPPSQTNWLVVARRSIIDQGWGRGYQFKRPTAELPPMTSCVNLRFLPPVAPPPAPWNVSALSLTFLVRKLDMRTPNQQDEPASAITCILQSNISGAFAGYPVRSGAGTHGGHSRYTIALPPWRSVDP
jgi:hypothetical protein